MSLLVSCLCTLTSSADLWPHELLLKFLAKHHRSSKTIFEVLSSSFSPLGKGNLYKCGYSGKAYGFNFSPKGVEMSSKPSIEKRGQRTTSGKKIQLGKLVCILSVQSFLREQI